MKTGLELLRIILIFAFLGALGWFIIQGIYAVNGVVEGYGWLGVIAILLLLFVFYRNKLQFSGWYKGKNRVKLPKSVSVILVSCSIILMIIPILLD